jgi:hypothetical protein
MKVARMEPWLPGPDDLPCSSAFISSTYVAAGPLWY